VPRTLLAWAALVCAVVCAATCAASVAAASSARAATQPSVPAAIRHVVIVGVPGLRWDDVTAQGTPTLWRLTGDGSVGDLVDYDAQPFGCPAGGWLALNSGARAAAPGSCQSLPAVITTGNGARIPAMPQIVAYNRQFHQSPDWGLLASLAGCATAVGPGAALALAGPSGAVPAYLPAPSAITAGALAQCPLTVVDLTTLPPSPERSILTPLDHSLARITADLPQGTLLLITAPGAAPGGRPHLLSVVVNGPGYAAGLLHATSTRQPGIVTITDLTTAVAGWFGRVVPSYVVGARITSGPRGSLTATVSSLTGRDTAEQVWMATHSWFFVIYALADVILLAVPLLCWPGGDRRRRRLRARWWRTAGTFLAVVPVATFLANVVPWWSYSHPAACLYGIAVCWALVLGVVALGVTRGSRDGPFGIICLFTLGVLGVDVMTGSRLQLEAPFGLSLLEAGRFYGIGNEALGVYCVSAVVGAAWLGMVALERWPGRRGIAVACASAVGLFAVVASGWPGFGAKVGGTIAMVPCFVILALALRGVRIGWRKAVPIALSGLAVFGVFALVSYLFPAAGVSDIGAFAGNLVHGQGGALLERKVSSNLGTLTVSVLSPLVPVAVVVTGLALWRPSWFRLAALGAALGAAFEARPLLRVTAWLVWLVLVIGWLADDSGVIVPAAALPFVVPLMIGTCTHLSSVDGEATGYLGSTFAGASVAGQTP
jgi:hypothetical protein